MGMDVLVVDDEPQIRGLIKVALSEDADVLAVDDGPSALRALADYRFDCVLLDVMMPGMSGFAVLEALRADPKHREVPVIMLTARTGEVDHLEAFRDGANAYLTKPFDVDVLLDTVADLVGAEPKERARRRAQALQQAELLARIETSFGR